MAKDYQKTRSGLVAINKDQNIVSAGDLSRTKQDVSQWSGKGGLLHNKGWAVCDGSTYDPLVFPELDDALGNPVSKVVPNGPYKTRYLDENDLTITATGGAQTPTLVSIKAYTDDSGQWRLNGIYCSDHSSGATSATIEIDGILFPSGITQRINAGATGDTGNNEDNDIVLARATTNSNNITLIAISSINRWRLEFDLVLASKPTWADANLEDYPIIATANNVLSNSLGLPEATSQGAGLLTLDQNAEAGSNKIIGGGFDFWQRATSQSTGGYGSFDRWRVEVGTSSQTTSRQNFSTGQTEVEGNPLYYASSIVSSVANANAFATITTKIENVSTLNGQKATLSFYAKADASKNIAIEFVQNFGTGGSPSGTINEIGVTTISLTANWQKHTVTVDLPSISGKTLGTDNNDWLQIYFWFDAGSNFDSRTNSLGQQSGTFDIAQVKLEEGSQASKFTRAGGTYAGELALCQRYCFVLLASELSSVGYGARATTNIYNITYETPVPLRDAPTINLSNGNILYTGSAATITTNVNPTFNSLEGDKVNTRTNIGGEPSSPTVARLDASAKLIFDSEL